MAKKRETATPRVLVHAEEASASAATGAGKTPEHGTCTTIVNCCDDRPPKHPNVLAKKDCCCFEVFMTRCKIVKQDFFDGKAEFMLTGYANDQQATFPGMALWLVHHKKWNWRTIHKRVGRFCVERGATLPVYLMLDAIEADASAGGNWEMGSSQPTSPILSLQCGTGTPVANLTVGTQRVKNFAAGVTCIIEVEFAAFEVSCCCCD